MTWEQTRLLTLPPDATGWHPASGEKRAVYSFGRDEIALWAQGQQRRISKLDEGARIRHVAFSPDESLVAVATVHPGPGGHWTRYRLRIWRAANGQLIHELRPFEQTICEAIDSLAWTPDGNYVLAASKAFSFIGSIGIDVWNAKSGRHRGELTDAGRVVGTAFLAGGKELVAGGGSVIKVWDLAGALQEIEEFESSLAKAD